MKQKYYYVFLLGRPGCGKSAVYENIQDKILKQNKEALLTRTDDFIYLKEILDRDTEFTRHIRKDGGFEVTDFTVVDETLELINKRVLENKQENKIIFIEFARDNYEHALSLFTEDVLRASLILYIYCPFEICLERNKRRFENARKNNLDDHIVPIDLMHSYYKTDDFENFYLKNPLLLKEKAKADIVVIDNSKDGIINIPDIVFFE